MVRITVGCQQRRPATVSPGGRRAATSNRARWCAPRLLVRAATAPAELYLDTGTGLGPARQGLHRHRQPTQMDEPLGSRAQTQRTIRLAPQGGPPDVATTRLRPRATPPRASRGNRPGLGHGAGARLRGDSRPVVGRAVAAVPGAASQNNFRAMHDWSAKPPPNREERLLFQDHSAEALDR